METKRENKTITTAICIKTAQSRKTLFGIIEKDNRQINREKYE